MIRATSTPHAPWYVVPADNKWFARLAVAAIMVHELEKLDIAYPKIEGAVLGELGKVRRMLEAEGSRKSGRKKGKRK